MLSTQKFTFPGRTVLEPDDRAAKALARGGLGSELANEVIDRTAFHMALFFVVFQMQTMVNAQHLAFRHVAIGKISDPQVSISLCNRFPAFLV